VDLTPEQKRRVDGIAQRHEATLQEYRKHGVTWSSVTPAQLEVEQRLTSALMLQQNLVAIEAQLAPDSDPGVQSALRASTKRRSQPAESQWQHHWRDGPSSEKNKFNPQLCRILSEMAALLSERMTYDQITRGMHCGLLRGCRLGLW